MFSFIWKTFDSGMNASRQKGIFHNLTFELNGSVFRSDYQILGKTQGKIMLLLFIQFEYLASPPMQQTVLILVIFLYSLATFSICLASSRVGAKTRTKGPPFLPSSPNFARIF